MTKDQLYKIFRAYEIDEVSISSIHDIVDDILAINVAEIAATREAAYDQGFDDGQDPSTISKEDLHDEYPEPDLMNLPRFA